MYPIGTRVTVTSVAHLGRYRRPRRLIGRTGVVTAHTPDGMHILSGLTRLERLTGHWVFADDHLTPA